MQRYAGGDCERRPYSQKKLPHSMALPKNNYSSSFMLAGLIPFHMRSQMSPQPRAASISSPPKALSRTEVCPLASFGSASSRVEKTAFMQLSPNSRWKNWAPRLRSLLKGGKPHRSFRSAAWSAASLIGPHFTHDRKQIPEHRSHRIMRQSLGG